MDSLIGNFTKEPDLPTILVVDDEPFNIKALANLLKEEYRIQVATSGSTALKIANGERKPDLILLDVQMPLMDGYDVLKRLQESDNTRKIPVIFVTAMDADMDEEKGLQLGAVDYITKPIRPAIAKARIRNHVNLKIRTDSIEKLSLLDGLTNIPNRRLFEDYFSRAWGQACREGIPLSIIMSDIDHFKEYNDNYGHGAGDECLRRVARALSSQINRGSDLLARYGGEEFVAVLPGTDVEGAIKLGEDFRRSVFSLNIPHSFSKAADVVSISVGVSIHCEGNLASSMQDLLKSADNALYLAKKNGRNMVKVL